MNDPSVLAQLRERKEPLAGAASEYARQTLYHKYVINMVYFASEGHKWAMLLERAGDSLIYPGSKEHVMRKVPNGIVGPNSGGDYLTTVFNQDYGRFAKLLLMQ